jgi:lysine 2-monooxygenase
MPPSRCSARTSPSPSTTGSPIPPGSARARRHGTAREVAIIGAGIAGVIAAYELMRMGVQAVVYEPRPVRRAAAVAAVRGRRGRHRRARRHALSGLLDRLLPLRRQARGREPALPEPADARRRFDGDRPLRRDPLRRDPRRPAAALPGGGDAYAAALEDARFSALRPRSATATPRRSRRSVDPIVRRLGRAHLLRFRGHVAGVPALSFRHREVFGQVGFGTGGWDSDFPNSMLEILRVVSPPSTRPALHRRRRRAGARGLWRRVPERMDHWPAGTALASLHGGATRPGVAAASATTTDRLKVTDQWGRPPAYDVVIAPARAGCSPPHIDVEERCSRPGNVDGARPHPLHAILQDLRDGRPAFWNDRDPDHRAPGHGMTLTDRLTRGTYLFDQRPRQARRHLPHLLVDVDALKMLPLPVERRVELALDALDKIYPEVDIRGHIIGDPITVSWEATRTSSAPSRARCPATTATTTACTATSCRRPAARPGARHLPRRRRRLLDAGLGRGRGPDRAQRGLGRDDPLRRARARPTIPDRAMSIPTSAPSPCPTEAAARLDTVAPLA